MIAQVRTRKRGKTFSYIFEAGKTPDGKRKVVEKGGFATKAEDIAKRHIITPEQFATLLEKYSFGTPLYIPLLYHTGARISEILGLSWQDIDFTSKQINLHRQIIYIAKRGFFFTTLKTESSNRYIVVGDFLLGELKCWRNQQAENEKSCCGSYVHVYRENDGNIERILKLPSCAEGNFFAGNFQCGQNFSQRNFLSTEVTHMKLIVTVVGKDRIGIIASVTKILADNNVNILSINQNILNGFFNMILFAEASESKIQLVDLQKKLREQGESIGVEIKTQHQDIFDVMHKI
ncbi:MAG: ACT domain-containing protein [Selenomonadaceae bacterium]|nr:ACT domain-containing protein [Selenomonadaceae bacterium]